MSVEARKRAPVQLGDRSSSAGRRVSQVAVTCLVSAVLLSAPIRLHAQTDPIATTQWKRGFHGLAGLCRAAGLTVSTDINRIRRTSPRTAVLVVIGEVGRTRVDLADFVRRGGALLVASDRAPPGRLDSLGISIQGGPLLARYSKDRFRGWSDCPRVRSLNEAHPVTTGLTELIANGCGRLRGGFGSSSTRWQTLARLPRLANAGGRDDLPFAAALDNERGGRAVVVADASIFSNQMLICGDNAALGLQAFDWLREKDRTLAFILVDGQPSTLSAPSDVELLLPPPTQEEVLAALESLPPEMLIEFANVVAAVVEDEGMLNEAITASLRAAPRYLYNRVAILTATALLALFAVWGFSRRRSVRGPTGDHLASGAASVAAQRKLAAQEFYTQFRAELAMKALAPGAVRERDQSNHARPSRRPPRAMPRLESRLHAGSRHRWTRRRLRRLQRQIHKWRRMQTS